MSREAGLPLSRLGILLIVMMVGHLVASLGSGPAVLRLGPGRLLFLSMLLYAASAAGFAVAPGWGGLLLASLLTGAAAGLIDGGLNAYAAARFSPGVLIWVHACFGAGAMLGPLLVSRVLETGRSWRASYALITGALLVMALGLAVTRRRLDRVDRQSVGTPLQPALRLAETLAHPEAWVGALLFCLYVGLEATPGRWAYSLLTEARGVAPERAARAVAAYWASLTLGRTLLGVVARRVAPHVMVRACLMVAPGGVVLLWVGGAGAASWLGLVVMGLCFAPVFPLLIALTPERVAPGHVRHAIGLQVSAAALGGGAVPGAIGLIARRTGIEVLGPFLFAAALTTLVLYEAIEARARRRLVTPQPSP
jgi:fucose permease